MKVFDSKSDLRSFIRGKRKGLSCSELDLADSSLLCAFKRALKENSSLAKLYEEASAIAVYKGVRGELPCDRLAAFFREDGKKTLYPRVEGGDMVFCDIKNPEGELASGIYGIPEPLREIPRFTGSKIDIMIMPGLAFDDEGNRLGQGRGCYDRYISNTIPSSRPFLIGALMEFQHVDHVPHTSSDIAADMILCI